MSPSLARRSLGFYKKKKTCIEQILFLSYLMWDFFGTYGGHICGFGGFLTAIAALLYARARVAEFERSVRDLDWQQVSEMALDVAKLKKAAQKWQNNENANVKVSQKDLIERALAERLIQQSGTVQPIRKLEM